MKWLAIVLAGGVALLVGSAFVYSWWTELTGADHTAGRS